MIRIIQDGQFGSCGKGAYAAWLAKVERPEIAVRTGAPNAGHSIHVGSSREVVALRHIPAACITPDCQLVIPAGGLIDIEVLRQEVLKLESLGLNIRDRLWIDPRATVIEADHKQQEKELKMKAGSTFEGVGAARAARALRMARKVNDLIPVHDDVLGFSVRQPWDLNKRCNDSIVHVEMTQGYGLSREFGWYPYVTSSNILPAQALVEMGVTCWDVKVDMLMRTYPIRIAGNSGPLDGELTWEELAQRTDDYIQPERTTVTKKVRRIGEWDGRWNRQAYTAINPDRVILMFGDYIFPDMGRAIQTALESGHTWDELQARYEAKIADMWETDLYHYRNDFKGTDIHGISLGFGCIAKTPAWEA